MNIWKATGSNSFQAPNCWGLDCHAHCSGQTPYAPTWCSQRPENLLLDLFWVHSKHWCLLFENVHSNPHIFATWGFHIFNFFNTRLQWCKNQNPCQRINSLKTSSQNIPWTTFGHGCSWPSIYFIYIYIHIFYLNTYILSRYVYSILIHIFYLSTYILS